MTDSNRVRIATQRETTFGATTPGRFRTARITSEGMKYTPQFVQPDELRSDRMNADPVKVNESNDGNVGFELSFPVDNTFLSDIYSSAMYSSWVNLPFRDNDGVADAVITDAGTTANTLTFTTGAAFVIGHLVRTTGFAVAANNTVAKVTTGGTTSLVATAAGYTAEAVPAAAARVKVVGIEGASADIVATVNGLTSTAMNFTAMGIVPGMWLKIGGTLTANRFATAGCNDWIRVVSVAANAIVADNLPTGWAADVGTGKTIRIWFGDYIRNGVTKIGLMIEKSYLDNAVPGYVLQSGMIVGTLNHAMSTEQKVTGTAEFMGMKGVLGTTANGTSYDAATTVPIMTANVNVGRIAEGGASVQAPNYATDLSFSITNTLRQLTAIGNVGAIDIGAGSVGATGTLNTYFGSNTLYAKLLAGTLSSLSARVAALGQAVIYTFPRVTFTDGSPNAAGKNQDVKLPLAFMTSIDPVTNCQVDIQRLEYFEV